MLASALWPRGQQFQPVVYSRLQAEMNLEGTIY